MSTVSKIVEVKRYHTIRPPARDWVDAILGGPALELAQRIALNGMAGGGDLVDPRNPNAQINRAQQAMMGEQAAAIDSARATLAQASTGPVFSQEELSQAALALLRDRKNEKAISARRAVLTDFFAKLGIALPKDLH